MINIYLLYFVLSAVIAAVSQALLKWASLRQQAGAHSFIRSLLDWRVLLAYALLLGTTFLNMLGYRHNPYSIGGFINALSYIFVGVISVTVFKEKLTARMVLAYGMIILGVSLIVSTGQV